MKRNQISYRTLEDWRRHARLTRQEAADLLGISCMHYGRLENRTHTTTAKRALQIVKKTGVSLEVLMGAA